MNKASMKRKSWRTPRLQLVDVQTCYKATVIKTDTIRYSDVESKVRQNEPIYEAETESWIQRTDWGGQGGGWGEGEGLGWVDVNF